MLLKHQSLTKFLIPIREEWKSPNEQIVGVSFTVGKNIIRDNLEQEHISSWSKPGKYWQAKLIMKNLCRANELIKMNRKRLNIFINHFTGHVALRAHLHNLGLVEYKQCRLYDEKREDSIRILCNYPVLVLKRYISWNYFFFNPQELCETKMSSFCSLTLNIGLNL